jgi:hypothetical protein
VYRVEADWSRAEATITQRESTATITVTGDGDLEAAAARRHASLPSTWMAAVGLTSRGGIR